jgi:hypothetical protein
MSYVKNASVFELTQPVYQQTSVEVVDGVVDIDLGFRLWRVRPTLISPPLYILDTKKLLHSKKKGVVLVQIEEDALNAAFPISERPYLAEILGKTDSRIEDFRDLGEFVYQTDYGFKDETLSEFLDVANLKVTEAWDKLVASALTFNGKRDSALELALKTSIGKGHVMKWEPHQVLITPPKTGKSSAYYVWGYVLDKNTKNTLLGAVRWTDEKSAGVFHDQYYPVSLEQLESQTVENMLGFLLGYLEEGSATVAGGGADMVVRGACSTVVTANPDQIEGNHAHQFGELIAYMSKNPYAMGRRFGIVCFGHYATLEDYGYDNIAHKELVEVYRALEERANVTLKDIWAHPKVRDYCNKKVYTNHKELEDRIYRCEVIEVKSFLSSHMEYSYPHIRGGAIKAAIVDLLPLIASRDILSLIDVDQLVDRILEKADDYVEKLRDVNIASINYTLS